MIEIDSTVQLKPKETGKEFGNIPFQELPTVQTSTIEECLESNETDVLDKLGLKIKKRHTSTLDLPVEIPVSDETMKTLQEQEDRINNLTKLWASNKLCKKTFLMERDVLKRIIIEDDIMYNPIVLPEILRDSVLMLAHDKQGHNGARMIYSSIKRLYHWKGMKKHIYCTRCMTCAKFNTKAQEFEKKHFSNPPQPMEFICMDLIGEFSPVSCMGNRYALTAVCMLTGYTFCIPIETKSMAQNSRTNCWKKSTRSSGQNTE